MFVAKVTGSLVSNLLPFGGAAGVANTYGLTFSWGFGGVATSLMILVSGLANLLIRIVLPMVGLLALMTSDAQLPEGANGVVESTLLVLVLVAILVFLMLVSSTVAGWLGASSILRQSPPSLLERLGRKVMTHFSASSTMAR